MVTQFAPNLQDEILQVGTHTVGHALRCGGMVAQISAVEPLATRSLDPALDGGRAHMKLARHRAQRRTPPNGSDYDLTSLGPGIFLAMVSSSSSSFSL